MEEKQIQNPLETEKVSKLLMRFSIPTILTLLVNYLYNIVDQIFIGHGVGVEGIAATNVAFPFTTICLSVALLIGDGCAANISICLGRKEQAEADKSFGNAFMMLLLCGILIVFFGFVFIDQLVIFFGASPTVYQSAVDYSRIILFGLPFMMCNVSFAAMIRADGNPQYTMKSMMIGALINVILDPIFIFVLHMGVVGAAIATIIGQIVSGIICLVYIPRFKTIRFHKSHMILSARTSLKVLLLGIPSFVTQMATAATQIVMNNLMTKYGVMTAYGSDIALSAYGMMMKVYQIAHAMFVGVSSGTQPINGFNYGAKHYGRVKETYKIAATVAILISVMWFLIFQLLPGQIAALFIRNNEKYHEFAAHCFQLYMMMFFLYGLPMATASFFQAIGKPMKALAISLSRQVIFLIPLSFLLSSRNGLDGALYAAPIADFFTFLLAIILIFVEFRSWKRKGMC